MGAVWGRTSESRGGRWGAGSQPGRQVGVGGGCKDPGESGLRSPRRPRELLPESKGPEHRAAGRRRDGVCAGSRGAGAAEGFSHLGTLLLTLASSPPGQGHTEQCVPLCLSPPGSHHSSRQLRAPEKSALFSRDPRSCRHFLRLTARPFFAPCPGLWYLDTSCSLEQRPQPYPWPSSPCLSSCRGNA